MAKQSFHRLPVVSLGAEHLVMGHLMRRNILAYKAPPYNEGYDLICIHPEPRHKAKKGKVDVVRVQVKSRYATDCNQSFPVKEESLDAFDFLIVAFLNIGNYTRNRDGSSGGREPDFYTLPASFIKQHIKRSPRWQDKVQLRNLDIEQYKNEIGFEQIAGMLGVEKPIRKLKASQECE